MTAFALYDLDRTVLRRASFTPFLIFAARRRAPWQLAFVPVWLLAMLAYKAGFLSRAALKQFGLNLFLGSGLREQDLATLGEDFAEMVVPRWIAPGAAAAIETDRLSGRELVLVTAAMNFYAAPIGRRLGFGEVLATRHEEIAARGRCLLAGENCYGVEKVARVAAMLETRGLTREGSELRFYSDSVSDLPLFDYADEAVLVDPGRKGRSIAGLRGWRVERFA